MEKKKIFKTIFLAILILFLIEMALQIRSQIRFGQSIFNTALGKNTYIYDEKLKLKLLRKNAFIDGDVSSIKTNSLGLRSPEIPLNKKNDEFRIALLGASTVMGTYSRNNENTWSYTIQKQLENKSHNVNVINAGIAGYTIDNQIGLLNSLILPYKPDLIVWYAGFNDISGYCNSEKKDSSPKYSLGSINLPKWSLLVDLAIKNTMWLRTTKFEKLTKISPELINTQNYENKLTKFFENIQKNNIPLLSVTMARAFRKDMPLAEQEALSETARYYNSCFDVTVHSKTFCPISFTRDNLASSFIQETAHELFTPSNPRTMAGPG